MPGGGKKAFREYAQLYHEVGNEDYRIPDASGGKLPRVDPHTDSYRPAARAMNYRSEPFMHRLDRNDKQESLGYSSYPFGDPATPMPRSYQGDPTKIRILHAGSEMFHVFHLHGGGIRWRFNPVADTTYDYGDTGPQQAPEDAALAVHAARLAGLRARRGLQPRDRGRRRRRPAGRGRVPLPLPHRRALHLRDVELLAGLRHAAARPLAAARPRRQAGTGSGGRADRQDRSTGSARSRTRKRSTTGSGRSCRRRASRSPTRTPRSGTGSSRTTRTPHTPSRTTSARRRTRARGRTCSGRPTGRRIRRSSRTTRACTRSTGSRAQGQQDRPEILFNPTNGRPAFPLLRPQIGKRNPFSPNGHSGAPWLGETGDTAHAGHGRRPVRQPARRHLPGRARPCATSTSWRSSCRSRSPRRAACSGRTRTARSTCSPRTRTTCWPGRKPAQPLAIRGNIGDCVAVTLTNEQRDTLESPFTKVNMHIHHVQFDTQASDGVISGMSFEQSIRPHTIEDPTLTADVAPGATVAAAVEHGEVPGRRVHRRRTGHREHRDPQDHGARRRARSRSTRPLENDARRRAGRGHGVHPVPLVSRRPARQHLLARPRRRHPRLGPRPRRPVHRRAARVDVPRPEDGRGGRLGHDRRHPHAGARELPGRLRPDQVPARAGPGDRLVPRARAVDAGREPDHRLDAEPARRAVQRPAQQRQRPVAAVLLVQVRRPQHAAAAGLRRRPVRDPHDQRRAERGHAARRRPPVLHREPLPRPRTARRWRTPTDGAHVRDLRALHGDPRGRRGRRKRRATTCT